MKTNVRTLNLKKRLWLVWSLLAMALSLNVACNRSNNNNNTPVAGAIGPYGYGTACMNCNFAQVALGSAQSQGTNTFPVTINWQIIGDQNVINQYAIQGMNPQKTYSGPIALQGAMNLSTSITAGNCMIPAGQYQLSSMQAGTMNYGSMNIPQLVANVGGAQIVFSLRNAVVIDANSDGQIERIAGLLVPIQGPGYGVGYTGYGTTYPGYNPGVMGGMVNCNDVGVYLQ